MSEQLVIQSHKGPYTAALGASVLADASCLLEGEPHFLIDATVARLYERPLAAVLAHPRTIVIPATEENKSLERTIPVFERLVDNQVRRTHVLVAIGGGIIQDVTCFIASVLLRGVPWRFVPTTLLAQADSCIGSKSSINLGAAKNIVGTFYPPQSILIDPGFLDTLEAKDISSGLGEIAKVHAIDGVAAFDRFAADVDRMRADRGLLLRYIVAALRIKQRYIEEDEFDRGVRNIFNYGHSFGHAIESATGYGVPHGIAVALGMDVANLIAVARGVLPERHYRRMHPALAKIFAGWSELNVAPAAVLSALMKDKKNTSHALGLILAEGESARVTRVAVPPDDEFTRQFEAAFATLRRGGAAA